MSSLIKTKLKKQVLSDSSVPAAGEVDLRFAEVAADLSDEVSRVLIICDSHQPFI